jgi:hypothetical protein
MIQTLPKVRKNLTLHLILSFFTVLISQGAYSLHEVDSTTVLDVNYKKVVEIDMSKEDIHDKTAEWFAFSFKDAKEVIQFDTEDKIIGKGYFSIYLDKQEKVWFSIEVAFKNNKYRIEIGNHTIPTDNGDMIISNYTMDLKYSEYIENSRKAFEALDDGMVKRASLKMLKNERKMQELYRVTMQTRKSIIEQIMNHNEITANSLNIYLLQEKGEEDW